MNLPKDYRIETARCTLRIVSEEDIPHVFSASQFEGFTDGMLWEPPKKEKELLGNIQKSSSAWERGKDYSFTIIDSHTNNFIGRVSIRKKEEVALWDVGFWTHPDQQNKGYMSEALAAILKLGFTKLEAENIQAAHATWNKASRAVLEKNGFKFKAVLPQGFKKKGKWIEENQLSISKSDWKNAI